MLVLYENFAADYEAARAACSSASGSTLPEGHELEPRMRSSPTGSTTTGRAATADLKLGTEFDLVPAAGAAA